MSNPGLNVDNAFLEKCERNMSIKLDSIIMVPIRKVLRK